MNERETLKTTKEILISEAKKRIYEGNFSTTGLYPLYKIANLTASERVKIYSHWWQLKEIILLNLYGEALLRNNIIVIEIIDYYYLNGNINRGKIK